MRRVYSLLLYILVPIAIIRLLWRSIQAPAYRQRIGERLGLAFPPLLHFSTRLEASSPPRPSPPTRGKGAKYPTGAWIHAASVGEVQASIPLIEHFLHSYPNLIVIVTTTTPTGSQRVRELFGARIYHCYIPYDIPFAVRQFIQTIQPQLAIFIETEVWPNVLYECKRNNIPIVLANARLSERSLRGYAKFRALAREAFGCFTQVAAQSAADAQRLKNLGVAAEKLVVTGNIKFDLRLPVDLHTQSLILRESWGKERPVWIAASTHAGEEAQVLMAHREVLTFLPNALLVLVPRHPERFAAVGQLILNQGFELIRRSEMRACNSQTQVFLGDSMGELIRFFAAADVAFVGGSLVEHGGHNLLEPAALGIPVITGPYVRNFITIAATLVTAGAARQVKTAAELASVVVLWLRNADLRQCIGESGRLVVENNRGALGRLIKIVDGFNIQFH